MKKLIVVLILFISIQVSSQDLPREPFAFKLLSENGLFFLKSIPFSNQLSSRGKTIIGNNADTSKILTQYSKYLAPSNLFLSNNGEVICGVSNMSGTIAEEGRTAIRFYRRGELFMEHPFGNFIDTSLHNTEAFIDAITGKEYYDLLYYNLGIDSLVTKYTWKLGTDSMGPLVRVGFKAGTDSIDMYLNLNNCFIKNDTVYVITQNRFVNLFYINTGEQVKRIKLEDFLKGNLIYPKKRVIEYYPVNDPSFILFPKLESGQDYRHVLAEQLNLKFTDGDYGGEQRRFKLYNFSFTCYIDTGGRVSDLKIDAAHNNIKDKSIEFILSSKFDTSLIPEGIEKWYFQSMGSYRNKSDRIAREEYQTEQGKSLSADTINGIYIPYDLNDCFNTLSKVLSEDFINTFKAMKEDEIGGTFHMGLGLNIRNNWRLWSGSRLSVYFNSLGITHPDDMSGIILDSFHRHLNEKPVRLEEQISYYKKYWDKNKRDNN